MVGHGRLPHTAYGCLIIKVLNVVQSLPSEISAVELGTVEDCFCWSLLYALCKHYLNEISKDR
ncbi:hypothetical protein OUZ56_008063 [Daphnia magna]|uniref:Uncharacterized protein n=1 Tax=Daphnia magna TaxID=35525 RepID=A0ABR0ABZ2_9CRUS|nr:hypothetical protein OUZ56_008063 [Daphnia magna]